MRALILATIIFARIAPYLAGCACTKVSCREDQTCVPVTACPKELSNIKRNKYPSVCGFEGSNVKVCCDGESNSFKSYRLRPDTHLCVGTDNRLSVPNSVPVRVQIEEDDAPIWGTIAPKKPDSSPQDIVKRACEDLGEIHYDTDEECKKWGIVGGIRAFPREFAQVAAIGYGDSLENVRWRCAASIISKRFVLSAAHCSSNSFTPKWVRVGELDYSITTDDARPVDYTITQRFIHPRYRNDSHYDDIALFRVDRDIVFSPYVRATCVNTEQNFPPVGEITAAAGWGAVGYTYDVSPHLMKVGLPIVDPERCQSLFPPESRGVDKSSMLCSGVLEGGKDTCQGDSGGFLGVEVPGKLCLTMVVGVTSFGRECGIANSPGIYTRVSNYVPWIQSIVWPSV